MSDSSRLPGGTVCGVGRGTMQAWKRSITRRIRRSVRQQLHVGDFDTPFVLPNEIATMWDSPSDGKMLYGYSRLELLELHEENPQKFYKLIAK